jgi:hypothetical protein
MATKKTNVTTTDNIFSEPEETTTEVVETEVPAKASVIAPGAPESKKGRVKGTWKMYWGQETFDFEDGKTYTLPTGLYDHLKNHGNIYDTL